MRGLAKKSRASSPGRGADEERDPAPLALPFHATGKDILLLAFLGVFQLGLPCVLLGPLWAWLGAGETPSRGTLAGGAIVLGALALNEVAAFRRGRHAAAA